MALGIRTLVSTHPLDNNPKAAHKKCRGAPVTTAVATGRDEDEKFDEEFEKVPVIGAFIIRATGTAVDDIGVIEF